MVRVISVDGENVKLRVVSDCMVDDIDITIEDLKKPIPYGMGYSILPQSIVVYSSKRVVYLLKHFTQ